MPKLTPKQLCFVDEYLVDLNATQAAIRAGYSKKTANEQGARLLAKASVQQAIAERIKARSERVQITQDTVLNELAKIALFDPRKLFDASGALLHPSQWSDESAGAVASLEILEEFDGTGGERKLIGLTKKLKFWDKNSALEKAMKHLGLFEADNRQNNLLSELPRDVLQAMTARLKTMNDKS